MHALLIILILYLCCAGFRSATNFILFALILLALAASLSHT
jgi:hypothetical protein